MRLDRRLYSAVSFPADYGFVAGTEGADGDPLDALVLLEDPTFPGCWVRARVVGVFWIRYAKEGETHREAKIITVADGDPNFQEVEDLDQLPEHLLAELGTSSTSTKCWSQEPPRPPTATRATRPPSARSRRPGSGPRGPGPSDPRRPGSAPGLGRRTPRLPRYSAGHTA
jgi:Inorganic pyrophosphatase